MTLDRRHVLIAAGSAAAAATLLNGAPATTAKPRPNAGGLRVPAGRVDHDHPPAHAAPDHAEVLSETAFRVPIRVCELAGLATRFDLVAIYRKDNRQQTLLNFLNLIRN
jgi:hypothetical protein